MSADPYIRRCQVLRVVDGDTVRARIDLGWNVFADHNVRLLRVNAPEMKTTTIEAGRAARDYVIDWIAAHTAQTAWPFIIRSEKDDAFGRYLVEFSALDGANLSDDLLAAGHAAPYVK